MKKATINYSKLISTSWNIVKKHPFLWILGILGGYGGGGFNLGSLNSTDFSKFTGSGNKTSIIKNAFGEIADATTDRFSHLSETVVISVLIFTALVFVLLLIISAVFRGSLIKSIEKISQKQESNFVLAWQDGQASWLKLFSLQLLLILSILILMIPLFFVIALFNSLGGAAILAVIVFAILWLIVFGIIMLIVGFFYPYVERKIVLDGLGINDAFSESVRFVKPFWLELIFVELITIGLSIAWAIAVTLAVLLIAILVLLLAIVLAILSPIAAVIFAIIIGIIAFSAVILAAGFFGAFISTLYTGTYLALKNHT